MHLKGQLISLRAVEPNDLELLYQWENNPSVWHLSNTLAPFSKHILKEYIENAKHDIYVTKQLRLMINTSKYGPIGCIDLFDFDPTNQRAGIGILIADEQHRGKGYASEAWRFYVIIVFLFYIYINCIVISMLIIPRAYIYLPK
jgi:diamine N-acetyltransferase